jgi:hypothetical protein
LQESPCLNVSVIDCPYLLSWLLAGKGAELKVSLNCLPWLLRV